jgi:2'-5' RNA ligase
MMSSSGWSPRDVKPVEPGNFHFTLIFLGEAGEHQQVDRVKDRLAAVRFAPFTITYTGVGAFPSPRNARVVWVGVDSEGAAKLGALAVQVVSKMSEVGFRPDKPFSPHLTLFRAKNRHVRVNTEKYAGKTFGTDTVNKIHLKKSDLGPSGPVYSNIHTVIAEGEEKEEQQQ